jgi:Ca2+-binding EF-hand superfamily protein
MREAFSVLDTNSTGFVTHASVQETLASLGLQENSNMAVFFPLSQAQQISLPQFLNQLANILVGLSPQQELLNAFSVFDDDDNGQIDVEELKDALLNTAPEPGEQPLNARDVNRALDGFTGRRVFARNAIGIAGVRGLNGQYHGSSRKNGDVFRYHEFVGNLTGGPAGPEAGHGQAAQAR